MLTREERAKAEDLFGRNPDATMKDVEQTLGRMPDGMIDAIELGILRSRAKDEAKAAKAAGAKPEAAKAAEEAKAAAAENPFARVRITVEMTLRGKDDFALEIHSGPAEVSDEKDRMLRVKAAILKQVAKRAADELAERLGMPKDA